MGLGLLGSICGAALLRAVRLGSKALRALSSAAWVQGLGLGFRARV